MACYELTLDRVVAEAEKLSTEDRLRLIQRVAETLLPAGSGHPTSLVERRVLMKLPLTEKRRLLRDQAMALEGYYDQDQEWRELGVGDFVEY